MHTLSFQSQVLDGILLCQGHVGDSGRLQGEGHSDGSSKVALVDTWREDATWNGFRDFPLNGVDIKQVQCGEELVDC